jgi:hypothetical protein
MKRKLNWPNTPQKFVGTILASFVMAAIIGSMINSLGDVASIIKK